MVAEGLPTQSLAIPAVKPVEVRVSPLLMASMSRAPAWQAASAAAIAA
jgi:hypothetical protein